jgi:hypothetical protein
MQSDTAVAIDDLFARHIAGHLEHMLLQQLGSSAVDLEKNRA